MWRMIVFKVSYLRNISGVSFDNTRPCHQVLSSNLDPEPTDHYRLRQQMNNRRKKALLQIGILFMAGLGLAASGRASTESRWKR